MQSVSSGKIGYGFCSDVDESTFKRHGFDDRLKLKAMLMREDELRNSEETQLEYSKMNVSNYLQHVVDTNLNIQRRVLSEFGFPESSLDAYHCVRVYAPMLAPLVVYGRFDVSKARGSCGVGDKIPFDLSLFSMQGLEEVALGNFKMRERPMGEGLANVRCSGVFKRSFPSSLGL